MTSRWTQSRWRKLDQLAPLMNGGLRRFSEQLEGEVSNRKLRCLMSWFVNIVMVTEGKSGSKVIQVMDDWAEGNLTRSKLQDRLVCAYSHTQAITIVGYPFPGRPRGVDLFEDVDSVFDWVWRIISSGVNDEGVENRRPRTSNLKQISRDLVADVKDVIGNPFRPVAFDPRWRTSDVVGLAQAIYDDKAFERMPILADALMDVGCEEEQIIAHCRGDGPHVRGCWVVDLVLGKE